jgi:hypothetical protein
VGEERILVKSTKTNDVIIENQLDYMFCPLSLIANGEQGEPISQFLESPSISDVPNPVFVILPPR